MLIVQNNVKKGIEIPDLEIFVDSNQIIIGSIDKVKYADFLALGVKLIGFGEEFEGIKEVHVVDYSGDQTLVSFGIQVDNYAITFKTDLEQNT